MNLFEQARKTSEKKNWQIFCFKCDWCLPMRNMTKEQVEHSMKGYSEIPGSSDYRDHQHEMDFREVTQ